MFDFWLAKGWLHKLSMFAAVLPKPNIDFMGIRYYWFTATILLTIARRHRVHLAVWSTGGLNIDFIGGTAYAGLLKKDDAMNITELRSPRPRPEGTTRPSSPVADVQALDDKGKLRDHLRRRRAETRDLRATSQGRHRGQHRRGRNERAEDLPDLSVEQIFTAGYYDGRQEPVLHRAHAEKAPDLVQSSTRAAGRQARTNRDDELHRGATRASPPT